MSLTSKYSEGFRVFQKGAIHTVALHFLAFPYSLAVGHLGKRLDSKQVFGFDFTFRLDFTVHAFLPSQGGQGDKQFKHSFMGKSDWKLLLHNLQADVYLN